MTFEIYKGIDDISTKPDIRIRAANEQDAAAIFRLLEEVAGEIPVLLDLPERRSKVEEMVRVCCDAGESWVAASDDLRVTGFLLVEPDQIERFHHNNGALHLAYAGVPVNCRGRGVFKALVGKAMTRNVPLTATVKHNNQAAMRQRLLNYGFAVVTTTAEQDNLRWTPPENNNPYDAADRAAPTTTV